MMKFGGLNITQAPAQPPRVPTFTRLPGKYKLPEYAIYPPAASTSSAETEYLAYSIASLSPAGTDLVNFWNASFVSQDFTSN
jgi:hypothetical protein